MKIVLISFVALVIFVGYIVRGSAVYVDTLTAECEAKGGLLYNGRGGTLCLRPEAVISLRRN